MEKRDYQMDNIRFFLIFSVVLGHLLEQFSGYYSSMLYRFIYTFHIPVFVFITGFFAKFKPKKILLAQIYPYVLFQTLYLVFYARVITGEGTVTFSYMTPYWMLWYLLVVILYNMLIPLLQWERAAERLLIFVCSVGAALLAGYDASIGYYMALSRFFCFLPFFVAGYFAGHDPGNSPFQHLPPGKKGCLAAVCLVMLLFAERFVLLHRGSFPEDVLYGSFSYAERGYTWKHRALLMGIGFAWVLVLRLAAPDRKLPVISVIGKNTLPIFLFHGFLMHLLEKNHFFHYNQMENLMLAAVIALLIILILGSPMAARIYNWFFTGHWIEALLVRIEEHGKRKVN